MSQIRSIDRLGRISLAVLVFGSALAASGSAQTQSREPAPVRVDNRGPEQAVPVRVENRGAGQSLPVSVTASVAVHTERVPLDVAIRDSRVLPVELAPAQWEYREIRYSAGTTPIALLNAAGRDGWETTGIMYQLPSESAILLRRQIR